MDGQLITIEGIDGSGKGTQAKLLADELSARGIATKLYSFPSYNSTFFGREVGAYLRGEFGTIDEVHPKLASVLFAGDRFEKKEQIERDLANGRIVICDRYTNSNIAHQCAKMNRTNHPEFINWIQTLEYEVLGLPRPDRIFFLDIPPEIARTLVLKKSERDYTASKEDIHEESYSYIEKVHEAYRNLSHLEDWTVIECMRMGEVLSINEINRKLISFFI
ncbi:dTMP kinase [Stenotrophomonas maltophilia]|uniref:Thymidylate kinase n=1 Tax=Stenotrophomonas riyadhensis TaxID=2859893 RepID=A0ABT2XHH9_9GAMM|nr:dTMP kinase [Stenotrophomonas sp. CFS3442]MBH1618216.1 dTMP kinase [Stenotrophomonas maltophilia]MCV0325393.1 dTMP kinase [Stenotrophomonas sp. CFS3442]HEL4244405.1 dTMP kinase [Stenotrophomonas maltophilia]